MGAAVIRFAFARLYEEAARRCTSAQFISKVAHEINNPLAGVTNCFQLVKQAVPPDHRYGPFAELIERELERIGRLVWELHELSRPDGAPARPVSVRRAIDDVKTILAPLCRQYQTLIRSDVCPDGLQLHLAPGLLPQILCSLTTNAIEASPEGAAVQIDAKISEGECAITVRDFGPGVPDHVSGDLFTPGFTTKCRGASGGLGLGLSMAKALAESAAGSLRLITVPGPGAAFQIRLPICHEARETAGRGRLQSRPAGYSEGVPPRKWQPVSSNGVL